VNQYKKDTEDSEKRYQNALQENNMMYEIFSQKMVIFYLYIYMYKLEFYIVDIIGIRRG
jgi:hypothetical protein